MGQDCEALGWQAPGCVMKELPAREILTDRASLNDVAFRV